MQRYFFSLIFSFLFLSLYSQEKWEDFTGKQRAFFYQLTRKVENMNPIYFHLFQFTDSIPMIGDTIPDYGYAEKMIENDSTKIIHHKSEFARKNNGILSDIATHYAAWELSEILHFRASKDEKHAHLIEKMKVFEQFVAETAPQSSLERDEKGFPKIKNSLIQFYAPNLTISEKVAAIKNAPFSTEDQLLIIRAIYFAKEKYINTRSLEIFKILGGKVGEYHNFLIAAGDGDSWSELESVYRTKYNRTLPDPKALFLFDSEIVDDKKTKQKKLNIVHVPVRSLHTKSNLPTHIHFDVWGYHPERQTTIVVQKGGKSYILYGQNEHRYVSPDSTYGEGVTYWSLIHELKDVHIADLKEKIYGKKGFDYWIAEYEKRIVKTRLDIKKTEERLDELRHTPTGTPKMKKNKKKKKSLGFSDQDNQGHPKGKPTGTAKKRQVQQAKLVEYQGRLSHEMEMLKTLKEDKEKAFDILAEYETKLDLMQKNIGYIFMNYKKSKKSENYIFGDSVTFHYDTQDLIFPPDYREQSFDIFVISFGEDVFAKSIDESFVHINITYPKPEEKYTMYKEVLASENQTKLSVSDSIQIMELFWALGNKNTELDIQSTGYGILGGEAGNYYRDTKTFPIPYEKENENTNTVYTYHANVDEKVSIEIKAYRSQMIPFNFNEKYGKYYLSAKSKIPSLNEIDFYTVILAKKRMDSFLEQLNNLADIWLINQDIQSVVKSKISKAKNINLYSSLSKNKIKVPKEK